MTIENLKFKPIGIIHTPYKTREEAPHQGFTRDDISEIEVFDEFANGLKGIERFTKLFIIYCLHKAEDPPPELMVRPFSNPEDDAERDEPRGLFSTCAPVRPNPIALTLVELVERDGNVLKVKGMDAIDGSPLLDIKPYIY
jgi:tRNA-Thr(GGU) m(6)t(6)A37 methyltransferase TsaA